MPGANYEGFTVMYQDSADEIASVGAGVSVAVADDAGVDLAESPLTTDANGEIAAGTLSGVSPGDRVHFRVENYNGRAFSIAQIVT